MPQGNGPGFVLAVRLVVIATKTELKIRWPEIQSKLTIYARIGSAVLRIACGSTDFITHQLCAQHQFMHIPCKRVVPARGSCASIKSAGETSSIVVHFIPGL